MKFSLVSNEESSLFRARLWYIGGALGILFIVLVFRIWYMQTIDGGYYAEVARGNRIRVIPKEAPRGQIFDRNGENLALNLSSYNVMLMREDAPDLSKTLRNLSTLAGVPLKTLEDLAEEAKKAPRYKSVMVLEDVPDKTADLIDTYQDDIPGVSVEIKAKRLYPNAFLTSHVVGYVGDIHENQLRNMPLSKLSSAQIVGQAGLELSMNNLLIGTDGGRQVEVDHIGRELRVINKPVNPTPGANITLTVDLRLQQFLRNMMRGYKGVALVMAPTTGEILGMVSSPDYDPNQFLKGIDEKKWRSFIHGVDKPLMNKTIHGVYPPGSTFKMLTAAAALDLKVIDKNTKLNCPGYYRVGRDISYCWNRSGHGDLTVTQALKYSCNVFFYQLGLMVGVERLREYSRMFGFAQPTGVELGGEKTGFFPSKAWKKSALRQPWYIGETMHLAIGQGYMTITPLQLLNYVNVLANNGTWVRPTIIRSVVDPDGMERISKNDLPRETRILPLSTDHLATIREGMVQAVNGPGGTAHRAASPYYLVAGKTGTSQVVGRGKKDMGTRETLPHSFFVAYAPAYDPQISVMVLVEHGMAGGEVSAPLVRQVMDFYFNNIETVRPPLVKPVSDEKDNPELNDSDAIRQFREKLSGAFRDNPPGSSASSPLP
ncbi:MAG: penicillin-binding protein 2 [Deltaproteobacteria bacterium]|nr:penicillin-binding protein 2 [Deltaproteobacteria bacterium]